MASQEPLFQSPSIRFNRDRNPIDEVVAGLGKAQSSIEALVYKCDEARVCDAVKEAADRGVLVRLLVDRRLAERKRGCFRRTVLADGRVEVRRWGSGDEKLHAKFTIIDRERVYCGSYNWTAREAEKVEVLWASTERGEVTRFGMFFEELWEEATDVSGP